MTTLTLMTPDYVEIGIGEVVAVAVVVDDDTRPVFRVAGARPLAALKGMAGVWSATWVTEAEGDYVLAVTAGDADPVTVEINAYDGGGSGTPLNELDLDIAGLLATATSLTKIGLSGAFASLSALAVSAAATKTLSRDRRFLPRLNTVRAVMASPVTIGAPVTTSTISGGRTYPTVTDYSSATSSSNANTPESHHSVFRFRNAYKPKVLNTSSPNDNYIQFTSLTTTNAGTAPGAWDVWLDGTTTFEICLKGSGCNYRVKVDGEYVSLTPSTVTADGSVSFVPVTGLTNRPHLISVEGDLNTLFGGIRVPRTATVWKPESRSPRVIVVGDSFTEGTGAAGGAATCWVRAFADTIGWTDVAASGVGGTGYINPGSGGRVKFRDRIVTDVINHSPDIVIFAGGINDTASSKAAIAAETATLFAQVRAALPNAILIALSPFWRNGVSTMATTLFDCRDAIRDSITAAGVNGYFVDMIERRLGYTARTSTLTAAVTAGASTATIASGAFSTGSTVKFADGTRRVVTSAGGIGPRTITFDNVLTAQASGTTVTEVGPAFWTGTGKSGSTTGDGNSDVYVQTDGTHPTQAGHDALGTAVAIDVARIVFDVTLA